MFTGPDRFDNHRLEPMIVPESLFETGLHVGAIKRRSDGYYWGQQRVEVQRSLPLTWWQRLMRGLK